MSAPLRVLIVDDNPDAVTMLRILLEMAEYEVSSAASGDEALRVANRIRPDVVLLDIGLPGLNGYEVCRRLRAEPWGQAMLIAAQTGWDGDDERQRSREAGCDVHLTKPVEATVLIDLLTRFSKTGDRLGLEG